MFLDLLIKRNDMHLDRKSMHISAYFSIEDVILNANVFMESRNLRR